MSAFPLRTAKRRLALVWFVGAGIASAFLVFISVAGRELDLEKIWKWFLPDITPNLSLILAVLVSDAHQKPAPSRIADPFLFRLSFYLSLAYIGLLIATVVVFAPFTETALERDLEISRYWLTPLQALATYALGAFYVKKDEK